MLGHVSYCWYATCTQYTAKLAAVPVLQGARVLIDIDLCHCCLQFGRAGASPPSVAALHAHRIIEHYYFLMDGRAKEGGMWGGGTYAIFNKTDSNASGGTYS